MIIFIQQVLEERVVFKLLLKMFPILSILGVLFSLNALCYGKEIPFTQDDKERLIRTALAPAIKKNKELIKRNLDVDEILKNVGLM